MGQKIRAYGFTPYYIYMAAICRANLSLTLIIVNPNQYLTNPSQRVTIKYISLPRNT